MGDRQVNTHRNSREFRQPTFITGNTIPGLDLASQAQIVDEFDSLQDFEHFASQQQTLQNRSNSPDFGDYDHHFPSLAAQGTDNNYPPALPVDYASNYEVIYDQNQENNFNNSNDGENTTSRDAQHGAPAASNSRETGRPSRPPTTQNQASTSTNSSATQSQPTVSFAGQPNPYLVSAEKSPSGNLFVSTHSNLANTSNSMFDNSENLTLPVSSQSVPDNLNRSPLMARASGSTSRQTSKRRRNDSDNHENHDQISVNSAQTQTSRGAIDPNNTTPHYHPPQVTAAEIRTLTQEFRNYDFFKEIIGV